jgi:hypothetical protein
LITQAINCSGFENIHLKFYRWLNSDYLPYVSATVEVSNNASTWTTVWGNGYSAVTDSSWQLLDYDISSVADGQPNVYIRWGYKVASEAYAYSGWNIDDVKVTGIVPNDNIDIGLRVYDGTEIVKIACEPQGTLTSPLRIAKNGVVYGIVLVDPSDPAASKLKIQTSSGTKALRKF